ncbi:FadR/GntR family transcriptional regulator [Marinilactibacillus piezotolerans]|uniref:FadR/GntR family transcriptional regulator n=1 Tax=Marinilactibacillus piezotolerans TaxID=258723 RepID=UPI0009AF9259|nr:FadR/GntR family transcriptional regulator [Marinilactibacillus piezotolerans]
MEQQTLVEITTHNIMNVIQESDLQVGDRLPNEFTLAKQLNVSRNTVREAIKMLKSRNILEVKQGSGTFISSKKGLQDDPFGFSLLENKRKLTKDLFDIRFMLEPYVASLAAQNATENDVIEMESLCLEIEKKMNENDEEYTQLDQQLHTQIAKASGNTALYHLIPIINESIHLYNDHFTSEQKKRETVSSHQEIVEAIRQKDSLGAQQAMLIHLSNNRISLEHPAHEK